MPASPIRKLVRFSDDAKRRGIDVHHLNIGQPDLETPREMIAAYHAYDAKVLGYGPSCGLPELRETVAGYYRALGHALEASEVAVTFGGSEALQFAVMCVTDPGDEIVTFEPFYANYAAFAVQGAIAIRAVPTSSADGFHLPDDAAIVRAIGPKTKALLVGSPANPTGTIYTKAEVERLGAIAEKHDLFLISDEVYREFAYDGKAATSALTLSCAKERVIIIDSISKRFSACGARVGFVISKSAVLNDAFMRMCFARLCPATVDQYAAIAAYKLPASYFDSVVREYTARRNLLVAGLNEIPGVSSYRPEGAFYTIATLPVDDADEFAKWLLTDFSHENETVMVAPASGFYATSGSGKREVRIAYVLEVSKLERCLELLRVALDRYAGRRA